MFKTQDELDAKEEPLIKTLWSYCITAMILYFVVTFFNSLVRNQLEQDAKAEHLKTKKAGTELRVKKNNKA